MWKAEYGQGDEEYIMTFWSLEIHLKIPHTGDTESLGVCG